jgi:ankyrin repeat protein
MQPTSRYKDITNGLDAYLCVRNRSIPELKEGVCSAATILWLFVMEDVSKKSTSTLLLETLYEKIIRFYNAITSFWPLSILPKRKKTETWGPNDPWWLNETLNIICNWDEAKDRSNKEKNILEDNPKIEQFLNFILSFQSPILPGARQGSLDMLLEYAPKDMRDKWANGYKAYTDAPLAEKQAKLEELAKLKDSLIKPQKVYSISGLFTKEQLTRLLKYPGVIQNNTLIYIKLPQHAVGLIKIVDKWHYFNINFSSLTACKDKNQEEEIAKLIFESRVDEDTKETPILPVSFSMFSFKSKEELSKTPYPPLEEVFSNILNGESIDEYEKQIALNKDGYTALKYAALSGDTKSIEYHLKHGAKFDITDKDHDSILEHAIYLNNAGVVKSLLQDQSCASIKNKDGNPILKTAIEHGNVDVIKMLLQNGADPNELDGNKDPLLKTAIYLKNADVIKVLLQNGADPNEPDNNHDPLLKTAIYLKNADVIKVLLQNSADPHAKDKYGDSMLQVAMDSRNANAVKSLLDAIDDISKAMNDIKNPYVRKNLADLLIKFQKSEPDPSKTVKYNHLINLIKQENMPKKRSLDAESMRLRHSQLKIIP